MSALIRRFRKQTENEEAPAKIGPNNHKPIIVGNRGLKHDHFLLLSDFINLVPHTKKGSTIPSDEVKLLDEIATDRHCDTVAFFETRHRGINRENYFWIARVPEGPSFNFFVDDIQTIAQLRSIGNCMKGSRPLLFFDSQFDKNDHLSIAKHLLKRFFSVPYQNKHSKPFVDRAMSFFVDEKGSIVARHYQVQWLEDETMQLVEVGPRFKLVPNYILAGSFKGSKIWKNESFVSGYKQRKEEKKQRALEKMRLRDKQAIREEKKQNIPEIEDPMKGLFEEPNQSKLDDDDDDDFIDEEEEEEEANDENDENSK